MMVSGSLSAEQQLRGKPQILGFDDGQVQWFDRAFEAVVFPLRFHLEI
jgi:hypothetical protein